MATLEKQQKNKQQQWSVRETSLGKHGGKIEGSPETPRTTMAEGLIVLRGLRGALNCTPIMAESRQSLGRSV